MYSRILEFSFEIFTIAKFIFFNKQFLIFHTLFLCLLSIPITSVDQLFQRFLCQRGRLDSICPIFLTHLLLCSPFLHVIYVFMLIHMYIYTLNVHVVYAQSIQLISKLIFYHEKYILKKIINMK